MAYRIGLTGNIGCGKSAIGAVLEDLGAEYVDADRIVHRLLASDGPVVQQIRERFGSEVIGPDGGVDRPRLGSIVFSDRAALADLEAIMHPAVRVEIHRRLDETTAVAIVLDAIKLIENRLTELVDTTWVVTCDPTEQRRRLTELRKMTIEEAEKRIASQPPQEEKVAVADIVIDNSGDLEETREQVLAAWERTVNAARSAASTGGQSGASPR